MILTLLLAVPGAVSLADGDSTPAVTSPTSRWSSERARPHYSWPTGLEVPVVRAFEPPPVPWASGHRGVDLALTPESPVHAAADGIVVFAGVVVDRPVVSIDHADGIRTTYEPVVPVVSAGDIVSGGTVIGSVAAGHCDGGCLHFGARTGPDRYIDPLLLLRGPIRLYPWSRPGMRLGIHGSQSLGRDVGVSLSR